ncbi:DNA repair protein endonuclease SAE2/CtIP C-terminus-domain-containing protein [Cristinia sonorae]|uniref:DNA repair protein endonuclease SAE2/CtIP C-terminus-domain-containing protein n=1 Tax=Cristinia sonorae TaxID=1940300 RepID=A0A8K0UZ25_9AGAR|nr:DNA repair protein endonuclease SAE2/CtIP C-terminus-domain-containing protein [Cristinia sonorae]
MPMAAQAVTKHRDTLQHELEQQIRRADIAERALQLTRKALHDAQDANIQLEADLLTLRADNESLRSITLQAKATGSKQVETDQQGSSSLSSVSQELKQLQEQYDLLLHEKNTLSERYHKDYKRWNNFKRYHYHDERARASARDENGSSTPSRRSKGKRAPAIMSSPLKFGSPRSVPRRSRTAPRADAHAGSKIARLAIPDSPTGRLIAGSGTVTHLREQDDNPFSDTREADISSGDPHALATRPSLPSTPSKRAARLLSTEPLSPGAMNFQSSPSRKRIRLSPVPSVDKLGAPPSLPGIASSSILPPPRSMQYSCYKGKGRYAKQAEPPSLGESSRKPPAGFKYDEVVRGSRQRKHLHAGDCECCHEYYESVGPQPPRLQPPLWRSPPAARRDQAVHTPTASEDISSNIDAHKHEISRHRHQWQPPATPPGYWTIGFPDTQEIADINNAARQNP